MREASFLIIMSLSLSCSVKWPREYYNKYLAGNRYKVAYSYVKMPGGENFFFGKPNIGYSVLLGWTRRYRFAKLRSLADEAFLEGISPSLYVFCGDRLRAIESTAETRAGKIGALDEHGIRYLLMPAISPDTLAVMVHYDKAPGERVEPGSHLFVIPLDFGPCNQYDEFNHAAIERCFSSTIQQGAARFAGDFLRWIYAGCPE